MEHIRFSYRPFLMALLSLCLLCLASHTHAGSPSFRTKPASNRGSKWRIGYYEGGPYINYPANLIAIAHGLVKLGWINDIKISKLEDPTDSKTVWLALSRVESRHLQFVYDAYSSANWDEGRREESRTAAIAMLKNHQVDFMIAMGTWAGQDLANDQHAIPTMVVSASDPVKSGIVKRSANSGMDHVHAKCAPQRYIRQVRLFHDIFDFRRLGIVFEYSKVGRTYAALADLKYVADRRGFKLITCEAPWSGVKPDVRTQKLINCHEKLASRIDALYVTVHAGLDLNRMDEIMAQMIAHKIPTWSQRGPQEVRKGVLMSIARGSFEAVGLYHAVIMARIFNGAKPGNLSQIFEDPKKIAINLKTADAIGFDPPIGLLRVADKIYK